MSHIDILLLPDNEEATSVGVSESPGDLPVNLDLDDQSGLQAPACQPDNVGSFTRKQPRFISVQYARVFARVFDLLLAGLVCGVVFYNSFSDLFQNDKVVLSVLLFIPLVLAVALLLETFVVAIFENTPGKWLFGLKAVTWRGARLDIRTAFNRSFLLWRSGLACGLLPLMPFTLIRQFRLLSKRERTTYDAHQHLRVKYEPRPISVQVILLAVFLGVPASVLAYFGPAKAIASVIASVVDSSPELIQSISNSDKLVIQPEKERTREAGYSSGRLANLTTGSSREHSDHDRFVKNAVFEPEAMETNLDQPQFWTNPYSGLSTGIGSSWTFSGTKDGSGRHIFLQIGGDQKIIVYNLSGSYSDLQDAIPDFLLSQKDKYRLSASAVRKFVSGKQLVEFSGTQLESDRPIIVQLINSENKIYCLILEGVGAATGVSEPQGLTTLAAIIRTFN